MITDTNETNGHQINYGKHSITLHLYTFSVYQGLGLHLVVCLKLPHLLLTEKRLEYNVLATLFLFTHVHTLYIHNTSYSCRPLHRLSDACARGSQSRNKPCVSSCL